MTETSLNIEKALSALGGNQGLYKKVLIRFRDSYAEAGVTIAAHVANGELQEAERLAHTMKGLAGNLGAEDLVVVAQNLEHLLRNHTGDKDYQDALALFTNELARTMRAIDATLPLF